MHAYSRGSPGVPGSATSSRAESLSSSTHRLLTVAAARATRPTGNGSSDESDGAVEDDVSDGVSSSFSGYTRHRGFCTSMPRLSVFVFGLLIAGARLASCVEHLGAAPMTGAACDTSPARRANATNATLAHLRAKGYSVVAGLFQVYNSTGFGANPVSSLLTCLNPLTCMCLCFVCID